MNDLRHLLISNKILDDDVQASMSGQWLGNCPFCLKKNHFYINAQEDTDRFGLYDCKVCGAKGNETMLRDKYEEPTPKQKLYRSAHDLFVHSLVESQEALQYLSERGFEEEHIDAFGYGYADGSYVDDLYGRDFTQDDLLEFGLLTETSDGRIFPTFQHHIVIPWKRNNQYLTFQGRNLTEKGPRYLFLPGAKADLYHPENLYRNQRCFITEGAFKADALLACEFNASAIAGTGSIASARKDLDECDDLWIILDTDENQAGQNAAIKLAEQLRECRVLTLPLPSGMEKIGVDDFLFEYGPHEFEKLLHTAEHYKGGVKQRTQSLVTLVEQWAKKAESTEKLGYDLGHKRLMEATDGLQQGTFSQVLGSSHHGKTTFVEDLLRRLYRLNDDLRIDYRSNDDSLQMVIARWIGSMAGISSVSARKPSDLNPREKARWNEAVSDLQEMGSRLSILDLSYRITLEDMLEHYKRWRDDNPDAHLVLALDGFSKYPIKRDIKDGLMADIYKSSLLKQIAQEANIPVISTIEATKLGGERPSPWNIRGSSQSEYDSDLLFLIYQEAVVARGVDDTNMKVIRNEEPLPVIEVNLCKNKGTGNKLYDMFYLDPRSSRFEEVTDAEWRRLMPCTFESIAKKKRESYGNTY